MNLILLFREDFTDHDRVRLHGRRAAHIINVHRAAEGDTLVAGLAGGKIGRAKVTQIGGDSVELTVALDTGPPPPRAITLVVALPRPKVVNRVVAAAASMGVKRLYLINAWRVEKSYWSSPRLADDNLRLQAILGLEQARDTVLPEIGVRRFFRRFVEDELAAISADTLRLFADAGAVEPCPRDVDAPVTLIVGPEGGFIEREIASLERAEFRPVSLGPRVLRVETAIAALLGRL